MSLLEPVGASLVWLANVQSVMAEAWPNMDVPFSRGPGYYLSLPKILFCWLLFLLWVKTTDLLSQDCQRQRLSSVVWNSVVFFTFVVAFILVWLLPWFWLGAFFMILAYAGPLTAYVLYRNKRLSPEKRILTPDHIRHLIAERGKLFGLNKGTEPKASKREGPPVNFTAQGGKTDRDNAAALLLARQSPGFPLARQLLADAAEHRAEGIAMDFSEQGVAVRLQIDGVWHNHQPQDRANGDVMLAVLKTLAAMNVNDRRGKQEGSFAAEYAGAKYACKITSQGAPTGERVIVHASVPSSRKWTFEELGMRNKVEEQLRLVIAEPRGIVLFSAPPAGGLSTTIDTAIRSIDRFLRDVVVVEDASHREREVDNAAVTTYNAAAGETALTVLPKLARSYPNVYVVRDLPNAETVHFLCEEVQEDRLAITSIRARECAEALLRVLLLKAPAKEFAPAVTAVVNQRMIRKLCEKCKEGYTPTPESLKQLGLPEGRVQALYRPPQPQPQPGKEPPPPCEECLGIGYKGRTAIFELLVMTDAVREVLMKTPKLELVRTAARKAGMRTLQEEGILLVAKGVTSVAELSRILKS
jgi:type II secretory ATPase GspE/PulE/Tfp pilus assembly ATPase PilB-like protein